MKTNQIRFLDQLLSSAKFRNSQKMSILGRKALTRSLATHATAPIKNYPSITPPYSHLLKQLSLAREILNRPLTLAEKIVYSHLDNVEAGLVQGNAGVRGNNFLKLRPDRVAMQGKLCYPD